METIKKDISPEVAKMLAEGETLIEQAELILLKKGVVMDLSTEWLTQTEYCKRFGISGVNVVNNWIRRGIIPTDNVTTIPELNNIRLIKAVPYHE